MNSIRDVDTEDTDINTPKPDYISHLLVYNSDRDVVLYVI